MESRYGPKFMALKETKTSEMKVLPSFVGDYDSDKEVLKAGSLYHPSPNVLNVSNQELSKG